MIIDGLGGKLSCDGLTGLAGRSSKKTDQIGNIGACGIRVCSGTFSGLPTVPFPATDQGRDSRQSGGMADALDSKSCARKGVWVRLPPLVLRPASEGCFRAGVLFSGQ